MRLPRPDLMNPPASQNAMAISHLHQLAVRYDSELGQLYLTIETNPCSLGIHSHPVLLMKEHTVYQTVTEGAHGIWDEKALKACAKVSVFVIIAAPRPSMATAPRGSGCVMIPIIVDTNTARSFHACVVTPSGVGARYSSTPAATEMPRFFMFAPQTNPSAVESEAAFVATLLSRRLFSTGRAVCIVCALGVRWARAQAAGATCAARGRREGLRAFLLQILDACMVVITFCSSRQESQVHTLQRLKHQNPRGQCYAARV